MDETDLHLLPLAYLNRDSTAGEGNDGKKNWAFALIIQPNKGSNIDETNADSFRRLGCITPVDRVVIDKWISQKNAGNLQSITLV